MWVNFMYNDEKLNVGGICNDGDCNFVKFIHYLESRMIEGNVTKICLEQEYMDIGDKGTSLGP